MSTASPNGSKPRSADRQNRPLHWSEILAYQDDTISRSQALLGGMTPEGWEWRLERGVWTRLLPGVAVAHSGEPTQRQQFFGVVLHGGKDTALSGDAGLVAAGFKKLTLRRWTCSYPRSAASWAARWPVGCFSSRIAARSRTSGVAAFVAWTC